MSGDCMDNKLIVEQYLKKEYMKLNLQVLPHRLPTFKTKEEVDEWITFMKTVNKGFNDYFKDEEM